MAGPSTREAGPGASDWTRTSGAVPAVPSIVVLLGLGLVLRLIIAYVLLPGSGFPNDLASFRGWGGDIAQNGPLGFYQRASFIDYPPVYLLVLGVVGLFTPGGMGDAVKAIPIFADLALAAVVFVMAQELGASRRRALIAAGVVIFNPVTWINSAIWGQADVVGSIILLLGLRALLQDRRELAAALAVVATLTKIQLGILGVLVALVVLRRSLFPPPGEPREPARVLTSLAAGLGAAAAVCLPFVGLSLPTDWPVWSAALSLAAGLAVGAGMFVFARRFTSAGRGSAWLALGAAILAAVVVAAIRVDPIAETIGRSFGEYPYLTVNAYNPWAFVTGGQCSMATTLSWVPDSAITGDATCGLGVLFGPFSAGLVSELLLLGLLAGVAAWAAWRDDSRSMTVALAILTVAFFVVPTRAHERYLFPFFAVGALLLAVSWRWRVAYVVLAAANVLNLIAVLTEPGYDGLKIPLSAGGLGGQVADWLNGFGSWVRDTRFDASDPHGLIWPIAAVSLTMGLGFLWALLQLRPRAVEALEYETFDAGFVREPSLRAWAGDPGPGASAGWRGRGPEDQAPLSGHASEMAAGREPAVSGREPAFGGSEPALSGDGITPSASQGPEWSAAEADLPLEPGDAASGPEPEFVPPFAMRLWRRLSALGSRPDRSASIDREPHGRIDRLDLWLAVALAVVLLTTRIYRLGEPLEMHFDEVYHARTAAEFLQDWRYNIPHDIYEWTHPHLAKYAIAGGLVAFDDHHVNQTGNLGTPVTDVAVEPRAVPPTVGENVNDPRANPDARLGDRIYVATGTELDAYDLQTRAIIDRFAIPGATRLALDTDGGTLYVATSGGDIYSLSTTSLDDVRLGVASAAAPPTKLTTEPLPIDVLHLSATAAPILLASDQAGNVVSFDTSSKRVLARAQIPGAADFASVGSATQSFVALGGQVEDGATEATILAQAAGLPGIADALASDLRASAAPGQEVALSLPSLSADQIAAIEKAIQSDRLPGIVEISKPQILVAASSGAIVVDGRQLTTLSHLDIPGGTTSIAINPDSNNRSYLANGSQLALFTMTPSTTGQPVELTLSQTLKMPGPVTKVYFDQSNRILQALGRTPDGNTATMYAVETAGNSVFSDAKLPFVPVAWGADVSPKLPDADRQAMLTFAPDGSMASVDIGRFAFAWRVVGMVFGVLMAVCLFLLARVLFRRRSVGLLVALFSILDGMFFVQSRIAMNDTYVGAFLVAAYLLFALLWMGAWRGRWAFWLTMPLVGALLGLALASKWVALYAIASIGILILIRSALGRLIVLLGFIAGTGVLGYLALSETPYQKGAAPGTLFLGLLVLGVAVGAGGISRALRLRTMPDRIALAAAAALVAAIILAAAWSQSPVPAQNGGPNYTFFLIMLAVTGLASAAIAYRPIAWTREEFRFAVALPIVAGAVLALYGLGSGKAVPLLAGFGSATFGAAAVAAAFMFLGQRGFGPLAVPPRSFDPAQLADPPAPSPEGWLRLGTGFGLPAVWMVVCLIVLPLTIYVASYIPWLMPWQPQTSLAVQQYGKNLPVLVCFEASPKDPNTCLRGWPDGHTGQTLVQLTQAMYNYHNDLRDPHAASSPWWAWPLDLKPVWFAGINYGEGMTSAIYDGGNLPLWWLALPAMGFVCWQAFKRRSLALTLIIAAFFWQWLSWARIDRASFQYHFYTALPFYLLALAYFVAELWHGPSRGTWLLARVSAAVALVLAPLLWVLKYPLCGLARTDLNPSLDGFYWRNLVCGGTTAAPFSVPTRVVIIGAVLVVALLALVFVLFRLERRQRYEEIQGSGWLMQLLVPVVAAGAIIMWVGWNGPQGTFLAAIPSEMLAWPILVLLAILAPFVLAARDARRFALGICVTGVIAFVALYPNISALPLPGQTGNQPNLAGIYNAILPTWLYGFQFGVNGEVAAPVKLLDGSSLLLTLGVLALACVAAYAAWVWRVVIGYRRYRAISEPLPAATQPLREPGA